ncbi:hypothetical protein [Oceanobacillus halophilus]|uniref:DUF4025 domain-containing protein n=1 Tax=Oceanobacillus halophilus TaxID=930130 RepID=A0A495A3V2_9BACI|nr:hypothetical protein [Oceanobacillus halophilus]RKQ33886.1 hypothetical protein D8M06_08655 [Oceanobacillus halophilus]
MAKDNNEKSNEKINVKLGGMGLYGTTSNAEVAGYKATGDIENAGQADKLQRVEEEDISATASVKEEGKKGY